MTFSQMPSNLRDLLEDFEIYGFGNINTNDRHNILLGDLHFSDLNPRCLVGKLFRVEGVGIDMFSKGFFMQTPDMPLGNDEISVLWLVEHDPPILQGKMLLWNIEDTLGHSDFSWKFDAYSVAIPLVDNLTSRVKVLELCAGGYAGWSIATNFLRDKCNIDFQTVSIEEDIEAVQDHGFQHQRFVIEGHSPLPPNLLSHSKSDFLLHADLRSTNWWKATALWSCDILTLSAPCQPWSGAASAQGMNCHNGMILPWGILLSRIFRPKILLIEQVSNFASHPHRKFCLGILRMSGYEVKWSQIIDASKCGASTRLRWLCIATRVHWDKITPSIPEFQMWPSVTQLTPALIGALFEDDIPQFEQLQVTQLMKSLGMDTTLVPPAKRIKLSTLPGAQVFAERCLNFDQVIPTIMAMYGSQHQLDRSTLEKKGYLAHFIVDQKGRTRLLHPLEIAMIHLTFGAIYVDHDFKRTWKHMGNQIAWPHALLMISNALLHLGKLTGDECIRQVFHQALTHAFTMKHGKAEQGTCGTIFFDDRCIRPEFDLWKNWHSYEQFRNILPEVRLPRHHAWTIEHGIISIDELLHHLGFPSIRMMSPITVDDEPDEIQPSPTQSFDPLVKVALHDDQK